MRTERFSFQWQQTFSSDMVLLSTNMFFSFRKGNVLINQFPLHAQCTVGEMKSSLFE